MPLGVRHNWFYGEGMRDEVTITFPSPSASSLEELIASYREVSRVHNLLHTELEHRGLWMTASGELLAAADFEDSHLVNTLKFLLRKHSSYRIWPSDIYSHLLDEFNRRGLDKNLLEDRPAPVISGQGDDIMLDPDPANDMDRSRFDHLNR